MVLLVGVLLFYVWVGENTRRFHYVAYDRLALALTKGRLDIPVSLPRSLLAEPFQFNKNALEVYGRGIFDYSLYKNKLYLYFGVVPALCLYMPCRLFFGIKFIPDHLAITCFGFGALLFSVGLLLGLRRRYFPEVPLWMIVFGVAVLGFGNVVPWLVYACNVYEVAVAAGSFFLTGALFFFFSSGVLSGPPVRWRALMAGAFLGLAVGCRPYMMFPAFFLTGWTAFRSLRRPSAGYGRSFLTAMSGPFAAFFTALMLYNYVRFGDPFEFGVSYQLSFLNIQMSAVMISVSRVVMNAYLNLFHPPVVMAQYPFFYMNYSLPLFIRPEPVNYLIEDNVGIFFAAPLVLITAMAPLLYYVKDRSDVASLFSYKGVLVRTMIGTAFFYYGVKCAVAFIGGIRNGFCLADLHKLLTLVHEEVPLYFVSLVLFLVLIWKAVCQKCISAGPAPALFPKSEFTVLGTVVGIMVCGLLVYSASPLRYRGDFTNLLILMACIVWYYFDGRMAQDRLAQMVARFHGVGLGLLTLWIGASFPIGEILRK